MTNGKEFSIMIERFNEPGKKRRVREQENRSLKIEQHEISSTEKCEISLKNTLKKETQKSKKVKKRIFLKN